MSDHKYLSVIYLHVLKHITEEDIKHRTFRLGFQCSTGRTIQLNLAYILEAHGDPSGYPLLNRSNITTVP